MIIEILLIFGLVGVIWFMWDGFHDRPLSDSLMVFLFFYELCLSIVFQCRVALIMALLVGLTYGKRAPLMQLALLLALYFQVFKLYSKVVTPLLLMWMGCSVRISFEMTSPVMSNGVWNASSTQFQNAI